jgi:hypothetical protein
VLDTHRRTFFYYHAYRSPPPSPCMTGLGGVSTISGTINLFAYMERDCSWTIKIFNRNALIVSKTIRCIWFNCSSMDIPAKGRRHFCWNYSCMMEIWRSTPNTHLGICINTIRRPSTLTLKNVNIQYNGTYIFTIYAKGKSTESDVYNCVCCR